MPAERFDRTYGRYRLSTDRSMLDHAVIHQYLSEVSYWAAGRDRATVDRSIEHSYLVIGGYDAAGAQVGFARMVTDLATWAWLCDVFVLPEHQGEGLGGALVGAIVEHPDVVDVKRQFLATADAHGLYERFGFDVIGDASRWMERRR